MRIPYEGMLASLAIKGLIPPLVVSVWGNDFTLHAKSTRTMQRYTRAALQSAAALHTDCLRDQRLAFELGYPRHKPLVVLPGGGGIQLDIFHPPEQPLTGPPIVINPRGLRTYVRSDTFFKAVKLVKLQRPEVRFACPGMAGQPEALRWVRKLKLDDAVLLLPTLNRVEMADLYRMSQVMLSITTHDGTPNTLLEAMASGCFPIAGDLRSIREWITPGTNGILIDPADPQALSDAVLRVLDQPTLRAQAGELNLEIIRNRAEYGRVMKTAEEFYFTLFKVR
jgi:glycosyltransferase involved in cell wall biosynthesis